MDGRRADGGENRLGDSVSYHEFVRGTKVGSEGKPAAPPKPHYNNLKSNTEIQIRRYILV